MPVIAGVVGSPSGQPEASLRGIMDGLSNHGPDGNRTGRLGTAQFGVQFHHTLPEDDFDRQPYLSADRRYLLVADARVDNRKELAAALGICERDLQALSDSELLVRGWAQWQLTLADRLLGDIALAVWDNVEALLTLVRTPLSNRPLFYCETATGIGFASLPFVLTSLKPVGYGPNLDEFARLLGGGLFQATTDSFHVGVRQVPQGKAIMLKAGSRSEVMLWSPGEIRVDLGPEKAGELIRQEFDRSVRARSRRRTGPLACMLSSGRDSSAVLSAAASLAAETLALTAAPKFAVDGLPSPWIGDESCIAADVAARIGSRHLLCRSEQTDLTCLLDNVSKSHFQPFNNPVNLSWLSQLSRVAKANGAEVIATGAAGNFTVSLGGLSFLGDFRREEGPGEWARLAWRMSSKPELSWSRILAGSFGSMVPAAPYAWFRSMFRSDHLRPDLPLLRGPMRSAAEAHRLARFGDPRPKPNMRDHYAMLIRHIEPGDKYSLANWGVDVRDPTADRRLADLCLSLPAKCLVGSRSDRPAYHRAFKDRLPAAVVEGRHSGAQAADWFQTIRPSDVLNGYRRYARNPIVDEIFDLKAITQMIERWPRSASAADLVYDEYCNQLLGGLAVASFINCHFPV